MPTQVDDTTWEFTLRDDVVFHDGTPFDADAVVATVERMIGLIEAGTTDNDGFYSTLTGAEAVDPTTVRITTDGPDGVLPARMYWLKIVTPADAAKEDLSDAPNGTGPYTFVDFKPGDLVLGAINKTYHMPNRPFFDTIEMKGGGDATSAARAVLQTCEYDYAWNLQVEDEVLKRMEAGGKGKVHIVPGGDIEFLQVNITDPWNEVEGERGSVKSKHFAFSDPKVREAMSAGEETAVLSMT